MQDILNGRLLIFGNNVKFCTGTVFTGLIWCFV